MAQNVSKVSYREVNNYKQGKSGGKVMQKSGPATGRASGNASKGGGIMQPTRGKKA